MQYNTIVGIVASILTCSSLIPQLVKLIKEKKAENVSLLMLLVLTLGHAGWIYYGILQTDAIIIASNGFAILVDIFIVYFTIKYKKNNA